LSPKNGAILGKTKVDLIWENVDEALEYQVELSAKIDFSSIEISQSNLKVNYVSIDNLQPGATFYWRVIASGDRPKSQSEIWSFYIPDNHEDIEELLEINVFPNPFQEFLNVEFSKLIEEDVLITLMDNKGGLVFEKIFREPGSSIYLDIPKGIASGPYQLRIQNNSFVENRKVIKRN